MAKCITCKKKAVFTSPTYCKDHFFSYIENKVKDTIRRFDLIKPTEKIAVAVSGGKDSQTVLSILHTLYGSRVSAIAIDEGIPKYRDQTLEDLRQFCKPRNIPYKIYSFKQAFGKPLSQLVTQGASPCRSCGVLRRNLLNTNAKNFDKLATGHNLDDECQNIIMNLLKGSLFLLAKLGPMSGIAERQQFTRRIKPLYLITEKETTAYAFLKQFPVRFNECPNAEGTFRSKVRDGLNELESKKPKTKRAIIDNFLNILPILKKTYENSPIPRQCTQCKSPSTGSICKACTTVNFYA